MARLKQGKVLKKHIDKHAFFSYCYRISHPNDLVLMYLLRILLALSFLIIAIGLLISLCVNGFSAIQLGLSLLSWGMAYICWPHQQISQSKKMENINYILEISDFIINLFQVIEIVLIGLFHVLRVIGYFLLHLDALKNQHKRGVRRFTF